MKTSRSAGIITMGLLLGVTACGEQKRAETGAAMDTTAAGGAAVAPDTTMTPAPGPAAAGGATVTVASSAEYGSYLADSSGRALYLFTADKPGESACSGACAEAWPPYSAAQGAPTAGAADVQAAKFGTLSRPDGTVQVVYNQHPLYYFQKDTGPGQTMGQDVHGFGGEWYLVTPQGEKLEKGEGGETP